jgi:transcriptional regulator GlxA family with amidase domain
VKVDIVVFDGMDELDGIGPLEVLRRAEFDVRLVGFETQVTCAYGLKISVDSRPREDADVVIFTGGGWVARSAKGARAEAASGRWNSVIATTAARGAILASVCTGAMILASNGALKGRRATTHHGAWRDLESAGAILVQERVVDDGDVITAGGVTSGIDLGLHLVERFASAEKARDIAADLEYPAPQHAC